LAVFSAAGSSSGKIILPADTQAKSLVSAIYGGFGIVFHDIGRQSTALYHEFQINVYSLFTKQKALRQ
jgi:hypothetical protein